MKLSRARKLLLLGIILVLIDQIIKILVKTNMFLGQHIDVIGQWFKLLFIENEGFAFGWSFGGVWGKYFLSAFRICLGVVLIWWIGKMCRRNDAETAAGRKAPVPTGFLVGLTIITAGALGNVIDCFFYGLLFSESTPAAIASFGGHYAPFMQGKVVDMFYFPIINTTWPQWLPIIGGKPFTFFDPVFNFADSCVSVGAVYLILFQWKYIGTLESNPASDGKEPDADSKADKAHKSAR